MQYTAHGTCTAPAAPPAPQVRAHNATLGAVSARSSGTGSVYLLDVAATGADVVLNYRQPDGRVCIATDLAPSQARPP